MAVFCSITVVTGLLNHSADEEIRRLAEANILASLRAAAVQERQAAGVSVPPNFPSSMFSPPPRGSVTVPIGILFPISAAVVPDITIFFPPASL